MGRLQGKIAIVTGAASGQGRASACIFAAEGAAVVVADINGNGASVVADEIVSAGGRALGIRADMGSDAEVAGMVRAAIDEFGGLDVLFNNAALLDIAHFAEDLPVAEASVEVWHRAFAVNLFGPMLACKYAIPHLVERGGGSIINTSSGAATRGYSSRPSYGISKAALEALTRNVAVQYGDHRIRCNTIVPGVIPGSRGLSPAYLEARMNISVTPYLGEPEDIAHLALFLASDESRYITGQAVVCDGGSGMTQPDFAFIRAGASER